VLCIECHDKRMLEPFRPEISGERIGGEPCAVKVASTGSEGGQRVLRDAWPTLPVAARVGGAPDDGEA